MRDVTELLRGSADLIVLSVLADGPQYGYAIGKIVEARSEGQIRLGPGVLYPLLHQMEQQGLLLSSWDGPPPADDGTGGGRRRKWYRLSARGTRRLEQRAAAHRAFQDLIESFLPSPRGEEV